VEKLPEDFFHGLLTRHGLFLETASPANPLAKLSRLPRLCLGATVAALREATG